MEKIKEFIFNKFYFMCFFLICTILYTVVWINEFGFYLNIVTLIWAVILLVDRFLKKPELFRKKYMYFLYAFLITYAMSILLNFHMNLFTNIKLYLVTIIHFLLIFSVDDGINKDEAFSNLRKLNMIFIVFSFILSAIGIYMYVTQTLYLYKDQLLGVEFGLLRGISVNPNTGGMVATVSVMLTLVNVFLNKKVNPIYILNIPIQSYFVYLSGSRSAQICLVVFVVLYFVICMKTFFLKYKKITFGFLACFVFMIILYVLFLKGNTATVNQAGVDKVSKFGFFNGRLALWESGFLAFKHYPIFGMSPANISEIVLTYTPIDNISAIVGGGLHNIIMTVLCATGLMGTAILGLFFIKNGITLLKFVIKDKFKNIQIYIVLGVVIVLFLNNMVETNILFTSSYMAFLFWLYMGYFVYLLYDDKR